MDLNSIIFPAPIPKSENIDLHDHLIWVPIYDKNVARPSQTPARNQTNIGLRAGTSQASESDRESSITSYKQFTVNKSIPRMPAGDWNVPKSPDMKVEKSAPPKVQRLTIKPNTAEVRHMDRSKRTIEFTKLAASDLQLINCKQSVLNTRGKFTPVNLSRQKQNVILTKKMPM